MESTKSEQLRVRVTSRHRTILEQLVESRNQGETLSDVVRLLIAQAGHDSAPSLSPIFVSPETNELLTKLAGEIDRDPRQVLEECVKAIAALVEGDTRPPLITEEIRLRRSYKQGAERVIKLLEPLPAPELS